MELSEGKSSVPSLEEIMASDKGGWGASDKDDLAGFNVCNKDTFHEMVFMSEN